MSVGMVRVFVVWLVAGERMLRLAVRVERVRIEELAEPVATGQFGLLQDVVLQRQEVFEFFLRKRGKFSE